MPINTEVPWELHFVLPNLNLEIADQSTLENLTLGSSVAAIVSAHDDRVRRIADSSPAANQLLSAFRDAGGDPISPAVMIIRADAPRRVRESADAVFGFRNAVSMAHVLFARVISGHSRGGGQPWSDTWDIHPTSVSKNGLILVTYSPAVSGIWAEPEVYAAMPSDYLPRGMRVGRADSYLLYALGRAWNQRFASDSSRDTRYGRTLFRSLEVAYEAARVGGKHYGSYHEYGNALALCVSAIEILAAPVLPPRNHPLQPGQQRRGRPSVTPRLVLDLLGNFEWDEPLLRQQKFKAKVAGKTETLNIVQRIYTRLYLARSRFLHGDRVSPDLLKMRNEKRPTLIRLSAYAYWTALQAYLQRRYAPPPLLGIFDQSDVERSLLAEFGWD